ncbi:MAG: methyltransferase domain-containing protein [Bryobacteraceae bacterium]
MSQKTDLYNNSYGNYAAEAYRQVRVETYGEDFGQTSWVTNEESHQIPKLLELTPESNVLEIGCGSGAYAVHLAGSIGCSVTGLDVNENGVNNANKLVEERGLSEKVRFQQCDVSKGIPFEERTFDAVFANDALCHIPGRQQLLEEIYRVLKLRGRMLFSDALIIGGAVTAEEIAARSSIGYYVYSPPGENVTMLEAAGYAKIAASDTTDGAALIAGRWHDARAKHREALVAAEGEPNFDGLQKFLDCVRTLTAERRLLRHVYLARRP